MSNTTVNSSEQLAPAGRIWRAGLLAAAVATVGNLVVYLLGSLLGLSFNFMSAEMPAPPFAFMVVFVTFAGVLAGTLVFSQMPRFSRRPISTFRTVALVALVLSLFQPLLLLTGMLPVPAPVGLGVIVALEAMHIIAGASAIYFLTTRGRA